ncbi:alpha/beta hydrolase [Roseomonas sp. NAR14]|uniref:Alpha/beta hydrolase n=1 Tax=Roseomonas acroporae TaxID=2937791 RepID=A0A9X1Y8Z7_9PROT|nr:alpha/beta hydrolase [Roseomonas acroporae]MCK8785318.1 alpha/beta hydrolase [Roseomonas acroporae]
MDRATLDREYSPSSRVTALAPLLAEYAERSRAAHASLPGWRVLRHGTGPREAIDFLPAPDSGPGADPGAPLHLYIHGGYWTELGREDSAFAAPGLRAQGAAFAALGYDLAPGVSLDEIVRQCRSALAFLHREAAALGVDARRIFVSGSSAGGHLAAMLAAAGWQAAAGLPADAVRGAVLLSGVFDLAPIRHCYVDGWLGLDEAAVARLSPVRHPPRPGMPVVVAVGENETAEFHRQSAEYAAACVAAGADCRHAVIAGRNHFDIVFDLGDPATPLGAMVAAQMATGAGAGRTAGRGGRPGA